MIILRKREQIRIVTYDRFFEYSDQPGSGAGYAFPCAENGTVKALSAGARENLRKCLAGVLPVLDRGVRRFVTVQTVEALGQCEVCGADVPLDDFTNSCARCGTDYNSSGQRLGTRECWGEETGEHPADVCRISFRDRSLLACAD